MDKKNILKLYQQAVQKTGFRENKKLGGWMPKIGPNDYRSVLHHGWYKNIPALIKVSPQEEILMAVKDFLRYQRAAKNKPAIQVSAILAKGTIPGAQFSVQQTADPRQPQGVRIVKDWPLATLAEKEEVAKLYWNTVAIFPKFDFNLTEWAVSDYFTMRLHKSLAAGRDYGVVTKGFITAREKDEVVAYIFSNTYKLTPAAFFDHFSNTDIVKMTDGEYFIWESRIMPKPEAAGIGLWLWAATLYAHDVPLAKWRKEMQSWIAIFKEYAPQTRAEDLDIKIRVNLAERLLSTLLLDLPLKRSPFDNLPDTAVKKARTLCRTLLKDIVG